MGNSILTTRISTSALSDANRAEKAKGVASRQLTSGRRINEAGQDATGLAVVAKQRAAQASMVEGLNNGSKAEAFSRTVDGGLQTAGELLNRLLSITTSAAADSFTVEDRAIAQVEVGAILSGMDKVATGTRFGSLQLIDGNGVNAQFQVGETTAADNSVNLDLTTMNVSTAALGISDIAVDSSTNAQAAQDLLNTAVQNISNYRSAIGAFQKTVQALSDNNEVKLENLETTIGVTLDADLGKVSTEFTKQSVIQGMARAILSQANSGMQELVRFVQ